MTAIPTHASVSVHCPSLIAGLPPSGKTFGWTTPTPPTPAATQLCHSTCATTWRGYQRSTASAMWMAWVRNDTAVSSFQGSGFRPCMCNVAPRPWTSQHKHCQIRANIPGFRLTRMLAPVLTCSAPSNTTGCCAGNPTWTHRGLLDFNMLFARYPSALPVKNP